MRVLRQTTVLLFSLAMGAAVLASESAAPQAAAPAGPPGPRMLEEAIRKWVADENYWAYTQVVKVRNGRNVETRVERFDPSQPDDFQWKLLSIDGKAPTASQTRSWQRDKAREMRRRTRLPIGQYFDFAGAKVASEDAALVNFEVPLRREAYRRLPLDKFAVAVAVDKTRTELSQFSAGLLSDIRLGMGLARITDVGIDVRFRKIDEKYAPQPFAIKASGSARIAFLFSRSGEVEVSWSDFKRVVPYAQRAVVEIGELRALKF